MRYFCYSETILTASALLAYPSLDTNGLLGAGVHPSAFFWRVSEKCVQRAIFEVFGSGVK
jgi:hypothetical protein